MEQRKAELFRPESTTREDLGELLHEWRVSSSEAKRFMVIGAVFLLVSPTLLLLGSGIRIQAMVAAVICSLIMLGFGYDRFQESKQTTDIHTDGLHVQNGRDEIFVRYRDLKKVRFTRISKAPLTSIGLASIRIVLYARDDWEIELHYPSINGKLPEPFAHIMNACERAYVKIEGSYIRSGV